MDPDAQKQLLAALTARRNGEQRHVDLPGADLSGVPALAADLAGSNLSEASLEAACLAGARLTRANLEGADLTGCDLDGADLTEANLRGADLTGASLDDAVFTNADLRGACLLGVLGDPLSMTAAKVDKATIDRSEFRMRDIAQLVVRGADVNEKEEDSGPPSMDLVPAAEGSPSPAPSSGTPASAPGSSQVPTSAQNVPPSIREAYASGPPSIVPPLRSQEIATRHQRIDQDDQVPASLRAFKELNALISEARSSDSAPPSMRPRPPSPHKVDVVGFQMPQPGDVLLGIQLEKELPGGIISRSFRGKDGAGEVAVVKVFDPSKEGAEIQLAAFQRGVRALNRVQDVDDPDLHVAELLAVATDQTAYAVRYYENGSLEQLVDVAFTMQGGLEIFKTVCQSVATLNKNGVLVRAIKPSNILIDGLTPLIAEVDMVDLPTLGEYSGNVSGYGSYAAPEEILGTGMRSPTADAFALGKLLEYLLTGHEPISAVGGPPLIADRPGMPPVLVEIVKRCLAQDPADRYQYVDDLLQDLEKFERQGAGAVLNASIRPGALSRLKAAPSLAPAAPKKPKTKEVQKPKKKQPAPVPVKWLNRNTEIAVGGLGVAALFVGALLFWFSPSSVDNLETAATLIALVGGLSVWLLPRPHHRLRLFRISSWAAAAALITLLDPIHIAALSWKKDLRSADVAAKERAVERLVRIGHRDFSGHSLDGVQLNGQDLSLIDFTNASLQNADLSHSFLQESDFTGADLTEANVSSADLRGSDLNEVQGIRRMSCAALTKLPDGYYCRMGRVRPKSPKTASRALVPGQRAADPNDSVNN